MKVPRFLFAVSLTGATALAAVAPVITVPQVLVTATRMPEVESQAAFSLKSLDADALRLAPTLALDGALREVPGFGLFRRSDSLIANPTAQGVSLRGLGPSGASRSLVLLDGVPFNDPFGGWVAWSKLPREGLSRAEVVPGAGATAWGNAALGGVVQLFSEPMTARQYHAVASGGEFGTRSAEILAIEPVGGGAVEIQGRAFSTDGVPLVASERRGAIDVPAWSRHRWISGRWLQPLTPELHLTATVRSYEEFRGNGTPYTRNGTREKFASLALTDTPSAHFTWNAVAYAQDQSFASTFSSVNATRTAETPASDQFAVPATAFGAAWTGTWSPGGRGQTTAGVDTRLVRGETRENFTFAAGNFTRLRVAGGRQQVAGAFALHEHELAPHAKVTFGARLDQWRDTDGHRRESDRVTGAVLRDDRYADRDGTEFSPSAGFYWQVNDAWKLRVAGQHAFRRPTLNELYRPFRQGANVTEANPALATEHVTSGEVGVERTWLKFPPRPPQPAGEVSSWDVGPSHVLTLGATLFWNDLRDAVGNVTKASSYPRAGA